MGPDRHLVSVSVGAHGQFLSDVSTRLAAWFDPVPGGPRPFAFAHYDVAAGEGELIVPRQMSTTPTPATIVSGWVPPSMPAATGWIAGPWQASPGFPPSDKDSHSRGEEQRHRRLGHDGRRGHADAFPVDVKVDVGLTSEARSTSGSQARSRSHWRTSRCPDVTLKGAVRIVVLACVIGSMTGGDETAVASSVPSKMLALPKSKVTRPREQRSRAVRDGRVHDEIEQEVTSADGADHGLRAHALDLDVREGGEERNRAAVVERKGDCASCRGGRPCEAQDDSQGAGDGVSTHAGLR